jgi:hypothetical protein
VAFSFGPDRSRFSKLLEGLQNDVYRDMAGIQKPCNHLIINYAIGNTIIFNQILAAMMVFCLPQQTLEKRRSRARV